MNRIYPETLKKLPIWSMWRIEPNEKGKPTKVHYSPHYNGKAKSNTPNTWGTFAKAESKFNANKSFYNGLGVGISLEHGLIFIDLDHCKNEDGTFSEIAEEALSLFSNQYIELSQSGSGIHILTKGKIPKSFKNSKNGVEIYSEKRFCSLTGNRLTEGEPSENQATIDFFYDKYKLPTQEEKRLKSPENALIRDDEWVITQASKRGMFSQLYSGAWQGLFGSQSEADLALCDILAFWCECDFTQMDRIFSSSGLYRKKWDRKDYKQTTINKAISNCEMTFSEYKEQEKRKEAEEYERASKSFWDSWEL